MECCKHLSYVRSLSPGKAVFFYKTSESDFVPLTVETHKIRGMKSGFTEGYDSQSKVKTADQKALAYGNPHQLDVCFTPPNIDEVFCRFSLRVEANSLEPGTCDDPKVRRSGCRKIA